MQEDHFQEGPCNYTKKPNDLPSIEQSFSLLFHLIMLFACYIDISNELYGSVP